MPKNREAEEKRLDGKRIPELPAHWVQEQSAHGLAPNFGDAEEPVIARAQNGVLYEAEAEGTATYMVVLSLRYTKTYESEDFA